MNCALSWFDHADEDGRATRPDAPARQQREQSRYGPPRESKPIRELTGRCEASWPSKLSPGDILKPAARPYTSRCATSRFARSGLSPYSSTATLIASSALAASTEPRSFSLISVMRQV